MLLATLVLAGHASITECLARREFVTSEVSVQVFAISGGDDSLPAKVTVTMRGSEARKVAEVTADDDGHIRVASLPPGRYEVTVESINFGEFRQALRISRSAQHRMLVVGLRVSGPGYCPSSCWVPSAGGPLREVPKCLMP